MSEEARRLAEVKEYLERRLEELRREEQLLEEALRLVNQALSSASFVRASELVQRVQQEAKTPPTEARPRAAPLEEALITASSSGEHLAKVLVYPDTIEVVFLREFSASTQPFESFFVRRVLEGYKRKDEDAISRGEKSPSEAFEYEIEEDKGVLRRIIIRNYGDRRVANELKSSLRWTLNKMLLKS